MRQMCLQGSQTRLPYQICQLRRSANFPFHKCGLLAVHARRRLHRAQPTLISDARGFGRHAALADVAGVGFGAGLRGTGHGARRRERGRTVARAHSARPDAGAHGYAALASLVWRSSLAPAVIETRRRCLCFCLSPSFLRLSLFCLSPWFLPLPFVFASALCFCPPPASHAFRRPLSFPLSKRRASGILPVRLVDSRLCRIDHFIFRGAIVTCALSSSTTSFRLESIRAFRQPLCHPMCEPQLAPLMDDASLSLLLSLAFPRPPP